MASRRALVPWIGVIILIGASLALGWILVSMSTGQNDPRRAVGTSLIGSSIIGFALVLVGQILTISSRRQDFLFTLSEKSDLTGIDLSGRDLAGQYLVGKNLTRANLSGADLRRANLARSTLRQANLVAAKLDRAIMTGADLTGAYLANASMTYTQLENATLDHAVVPWAKLRGTIFWDASLRSAMLAGAQCSPGKMLSFASALRIRANTYSPVSAYRLRKHLKQARILDPEAPNSISDLRRRLVEGLKRAQPVRLANADLTECDLRGADLRHADLALANLCNVFWNDQTRWPQGFVPPPPNAGNLPDMTLPWSDLDKKNPLRPNTDT